ncbi:MAG: hypothetical protein JSS21_09980 [Proteobacteria bacterium]|nr:hypothetical protein [Pseudomonadota bacterium]
MDISRRSRRALRSGADALDTASRHIRRGAGWVADNAGDMADDAWRGLGRAGRQVGGFARRRPVETALIGVAASCLIAGLVFWLTRDDDE